jgi:hypothetical protein
MTPIFLCLTAPLRILGSCKRNCAFFFKLAAVQIACLSSAIFQALALFRVKRLPHSGLELFFYYHS